MEYFQRSDFQKDMISSALAAATQILVPVTLAPIPQIRFDRRIGRNHFQHCAGLQSLHHLSGFEDGDGAEQSEGVQNLIRSDFVCIGILHLHTIRTKYGKKNTMSSRIAASPGGIFNELGSETKQVRL